MSSPKKSEESSGGKIVEKQEAEEQPGEAEAEVEEAASESEGEEGGEAAEAPAKKKSKGAKGKAEPAADGKPKQPCGAFFLFMADKRKDKKWAEEFKGAAAGKEGGKLWKGMSDKEKKPYKDEADKLKKKYDEALAKWKEDHDSDEEETKSKGTKKTAGGKRVKGGK